MTNSVDQLKSRITQRGGIARPNRFLIELPPLAGVTSEEMNILCRSATLPGKQILTGDRRIGMELERVSYGYAVQDVTMSFLMLKDYSIKKYFDAWIGQQINEDAHTASYKKSYQKKIVIHQLEEAVPSFHLGANFSVGPFNIRAGKDINFPRIPGVMMRNSVYSVELIDAFPTTIGGIELNSDPDGIVELQVQFSYTNWRKNRPSQFGFNFGQFGEFLGIDGNIKFRDVASGLGRKFFPDIAERADNAFSAGTEFLSSRGIGFDFKL